MLAQAQECGWQKAKKAGRSTPYLHWLSLIEIQCDFSPATTKNSLIAKIAAQVSDL